MHGSARLATVLGLVPWVATSGCASAPAPRPLVAEAAAPASAPPPPQGGPEGPSASPAAGGSPESRSDRPARTAGWVVLSVAAEATVLAVITSFVMLHDKDVRDRECDANKLCSPSGLQANAEISNLAWWNAAGWAVAGVGVAVGGLLVLTNPPAPGAVAIGVSPTGTGIGLGARGAF